MKNIKDFESFLMEVHAEKICGTEDDCLDDDLVDAFYDWLDGIDPWVIFKYADMYGLAMNLDGYKEAVADTKKVWERITAK